MKLFSVHQMSQPLNLHAYKKNFLWFRNYLAKENFLCLWNVLKLWVSFTMSFLFIKCPIYMKCLIYEIFHLLNVHLLNVHLWNVYLWNVYLWNVYEISFFEMFQHLKQQKILRAGEQINGSERNRRFMKSLEIKSNQNVKNTGSPKSTRLEKQIICIKWVKRDRRFEDQELRKTGDLRHRIRKRETGES